MNPVYHQAKFINSAPNLKHAPPDHGLEIAFAGRSNAGKSSALNTLTRQNSLARISKTPGRTQLLNFFAIDERLRFVDLPGYGFASAPLTIKKQWQQAIEEYLNRRKSLCGIVLVMDARHPLTEFDWQMLEWCEHAELPAHILLTKADKLSFGASKSVLLQVQKELSGAPIPLTVQLFSSLKKSGVDEAHEALDHLFARQGET
ncbi:MAG: ribosome biogenesis GTP-binding protein YihA/YsxC [Methylococcaceae bacterium]|nr:ribosome biogenesis GTP-binding protein YihA/YsxC [Methylococcaceae bacterium]